MEGCCNAVKKNQHKTKNFNLYDCKDWLRQIGKASCGAVSCIGNAGVNYSMLWRCSRPWWRGLEVVRSRQKGPILLTFTKLKYSTDRFYLFMFKMMSCCPPAVLSWPSIPWLSLLRITAVCFCIFWSWNNQGGPFLFADMKTCAYEDIRIQKNHVI